MMDILRAILAGYPDAFVRRRLAREYLQARILLALQDRGAFTNWAFMGGTALRFLFNLPRFSEDLDFALVDSVLDVQFEKIMRGVKTDIAAESYNLEIRLRQNHAVWAALLKFRGLLHLIGASPHADETLTVKIEIDTNPPSGANVETRIIRRHHLLNLFHYDRASLFAGKLHAVLSRKYTKGRDIYDLAWYLSAPDWPEPNLVFLNNALRQTAWPGPVLKSDNWRQAVMERLKRMDWLAVRADVTPFLERTKDTDLITEESLTSLLCPQD